MTDDVASARVFASEAVECARAARDWWAFTHATLWEANAVEIWSAELYAERLRVRREQMSEARAPHTYVAWVSASEAASWMAVGDWRACQDRLRFALGSDPGPSAEVSAHLTAARLATWQGRQSEAEAHLARADELMAATSLFLALECDAVRAEVLLGAGDAEGAFQAALAGATSDGVPPTMCQWLMPLAARALADLAERARDAGEPDADVSTLLDELIAKFPHVMTEPGVKRLNCGTPQVEALELIYTAERLRGRNDPASADAWISAVEWTSKGRLAWEETYESLRAPRRCSGRGAIAAEVQTCSGTAWSSPSSCRRSPSGSDSRISPCVRASRRRRPTIDRSWSHFPASPSGNGRCSPASRRDEPMARSPVNS